MAEVLLLMVPPIREQERIGKVLSLQDVRIRSEANKLRKLRSLKTALMQDLLTGNKRVTPLVAPELTY
jgi:type I restriction enzyme, S subunit